MNRVPSGWTLLARSILRGVWVHCRESIWTNEMPGIIPRDTSRWPKDAFSCHVMPGLPNPPTVWRKTRLLSSTLPSRWRLTVAVRSSNMFWLHLVRWFLWYQCKSKFFFSGIWKPYKELLSIVERAVYRKRSEFFHDLEVALKKFKPDFISLLKNPVSKFSSGSDDWCFSL